MPQRAEYVRRSPHGHFYVVAPWRPDAEPWELEIEDLLEAIRATHGVPYRIRYVADPIVVQPVPDVPVEPSDEVHQELAAMGRGLSGRRRTTFDRDLRNSRGKVSPGALLLVEVDGVLRWYEGPWYGWQTMTIQFLDALLRLGPSYVEDLLRLPATWAKLPDEVIEDAVRGADAPVEAEVMRALLRSGLLGSGEPRGKVRVGRRLRCGTRGPTEMPRSAWKYADLVFYTGPEVWVVEAKDTLNWEALGQALGYATLFADDFLTPDAYPEAVTVRPAIVCRTLDETIVRCAEDRRVAVFQDGERVI